MTTMVVEIRGRDLPGRRCGPSPDGGGYDNIHVGIVRRADTIELVPGDAPSARWQLEVTVHRGDDGTFDVRGPFVHGRRGERHLRLRWGTVGATAPSRSSGQPSCGSPTWTHRWCSGSWGVVAGSSAPSD